MIVSKSVTVSLRQSERTPAAFAARHSGSLRGALAGWLCHSGTPVVFAVSLAVAALPAQEPTFELSLRDGRVLLATSILGDPAAGVEVVGKQGKAKLGPGDVLAIHGCAVLALPLPGAWLHGGDTVRGALVGGDDAGDRVELLSPVLGRISLPVDRLHALTTPEAEASQRQPLPDGVGEAILRRAAVGYDVLAGALHQFGERGVRFQPDGEKEPRWFSLQEFAALRIADPIPRATPAKAALRTRTGDLLGVAVRRFTAAAAVCELENGAVVDVRWADLGCLSFFGSGTFLSDLQPAEVVESGFDGAVVHPWRRDLAALGSPLIAAERTHGKGLGVHSKSRLTFVVPAGHAHFWTRVAIDDSATGLPVHADADVRVLVDDQLRFEHKGLQPGQAPRDTGLLPVAAGNRVTLEVDFGRGRDLGDRVDWLSPVLLPEVRRQ